ncbi:Hypothetical_protein [Hexamita inflata]|uniref:Hypothetical_protein n=1 Tax=Hexamita inflata TaxID=28002 RepID=A0AA86NGV5_9EUKA|nr:Hypothetical protein HINF_LOCUS7194 [Hexamita inflata]
MLIANARKNVNKELNQKALNVKANVSQTQDNEVPRFKLSLNDLINPKIKSDSSQTTDSSRHISYQDESIQQVDIQQAPFDQNEYTKKKLIEFYKIKQVEELNQNIQNAQEQLNMKFNINQNQKYKQKALNQCYKKQYHLVNKSKSLSNNKQLSQPLLSNTHTTEQHNHQHHEEVQYQHHTGVQNPELEKAAEVQSNSIQRHNIIQDPQSVKVEQAIQIPQTHCNEPEQQIQLEINLSHHSQCPEMQTDIHIPTQPSPSKNSVQTQAKFSQGLKYAILTLFSKDLEDKTDQQLIAFLNKNLNSQTVQKFWSVVELHSNQGADYYQKQFMRCLYDQITVQQKQMIQNYLSEQKELLNEKSTAQIAKQIKKALFKEQNVFIHDIVQIVENNQ